MATLKEGSKAPKFVLPDADGKEVALDDFKGKTVVLYFYPKDMTSGCTQEACDFRDALARFKRRKVQVLGVSKDPVKKHYKFREKFDLNFPLLADESTQVCQAYGVLKEKSMYGRKYMGIERTTLVIDPQGKIQKIYPQVKVKGHVDTLLQEL